MHRAGAVGSRACPGFLFFQIQVVWVIMDKENLCVKRRFMAKRVTKKQREQQLRREVGGVAIIALGVFLAASLYSRAVGLVGAAVSGAALGVFGLAAWALPVALAAGGVVMIANSAKPGTGWTGVLCVLAAYCVIVLVHIHHRPTITGATFLEYCKDAFEYGRGYHSGGGIVGAMLAYPSLLLIGETGSYIFFIAALVILLLLVTKLSLRRAGEKVTETIADSIATISESRAKRQALYMEQLGQEEQEPVPAPPPQRAVARRRAGRRGRSQAAPIIIGAGQERADVDFLPASGAIARRAPADAGDPFGFEAVLREACAAAPAAQAPRPQDPGQEPLAAPQPVRKQPTGYQRPPFTLLKLPVRQARRAESQDKSRLLVDTLASFNISVKILQVSVGPVITRYELQPAQGVRVNRITSLADDIALALAAPRVRIEAPIPGKAAIGIEVPNSSVATVLLREVIETPAFINAPSSITFALGKDITGNIAIADLDRMPHLLIAGATGSGKSVCINNIIISMIYKSSPEELRLILVDPKVVELKMFAALPHLLVPVVTDPKKAAGALHWAVLEMEQRYQKMAKCNTRNLAGYNALQEQEEDKLPKIVVVIDELADLMMVAPKDVEESICRIAQLGRACGIHLIVATQRPSVDVITGLIKANIPSRIAFAVSSAVDSRVILDATGAEKLLGRGDMLFHASGASKPVRIQGAFVSDEEAEAVAEFFSEQQQEPAYDDRAVDQISNAALGGGERGPAFEDELLEDAVRVLLEIGQGKASTSMVQRRMRVGYARASRLIDIMEQMNIVSRADGSKPRDLLIDYGQFLEIFGPKEQEESPF